MSFRWKFAQAAEIRWWKKYLKNKPEQEYLQWKREYWTDFLNKIKDVIKWDNIQHVLDAGCGPAGIFMIMEDYKVDAIDPLMNAYDDKISHFRKTDYLNVSFHNSTIENFRLAHQYDLVFCINAINHVADLNRSLDKLSEATASGGYLVISTDAHRNNILKKLFQLIPGDVLHPHQYNGVEYERMFQKRDFEILKTVKLKGDLIFDYYVWVLQKAKKGAG